MEHSASKLFKLLLDSLKNAPGNVSHHGGKLNMGGFLRLLLSLLRNYYYYYYSGCFWFQNKARAVLKCGQEHRQLSTILSKSLAPQISRRPKRVRLYRSNNNNNRNKNMRIYCRKFGGALASRDSLNRIADNLKASSPMSMLYEPSLLHGVLARTHKQTLKHTSHSATQSRTHTTLRVTSAATPGTDGHSDLREHKDAAGGGRVPHLQSPAHTQSAHSHCRMRSASRRHVNPVPRHKRDAHINAEYRRRDKIQRGFDTVCNLVPALHETPLGTKESKASMLNKSADYVRQLTAECREQEHEKETLKDELEKLHKELEQYQQQLPSSGVHVLGRPSFQTQRTLEDYLRESTAKDWRFWIFSHVVRPLFESYNRHVSMATIDDFIGSVAEWSDGHLNLVNMRPIILSTLRGISKRTSIITHPELLEKEVQGMTAFHEGDSHI